MLNPIQYILNTKMRNKMIFMCIIVIVPVFLAGVYLIFSTSKILQENTVKQAKNDADNLSYRLKDLLYTTKSISDRVYNNEELRYLLNNEFESYKDYQEYFSSHTMISDYLNAYPQFENISFYLDIDGFMYNSVFIKLDDMVKQTYWYKKAVESNKTVWYVVKDPYDDEMYLSLIRSIYNNKNQQVGVMVMSMKSDWIEDLMQDEVYNVIFTLQNGVAFYSDVKDMMLGNVIPLSNTTFLAGTSDTILLGEEEPFLDEKGYVIVSYFDYENSGNLFQIFLIKSRTMFTGATKELTTTYIWYMTACAILSVLIAVLISSLFSRRIQFLKSEMHKVAEGDFKLEEKINGTDEIFDLYSDLQVMVNSMQELIDEAYKSKMQSETFKLNQIEAEFKALASQINPHFLYNTLETIRMKAYCNNDKETADLVKKLGKFMRRCLEIKDGMVTLESELSFTNSYLELQKARFGDRVTYSIYCEVDREYKILPLIIQPLVENAFVHGIEGMKTNGNIDIKVYYKGEMIYIDVNDNGQGISEERLSMLRNKLIINDTSSGKSIGLTNVNKRIKMYHGENYGLTLKSIEGKGTRIRVNLPRYVDENYFMKSSEAITVSNLNLNSFK